MRALVVAGEGRAFCAGADIGELDNLDGPHGFGAFVHGLTDTGREGPGADAGGRADVDKSPLIHQPSLIYPGCVELQPDMGREGSAPEFLGLVADPVRWRLLCELGRSDRQVRELVGLVDQPQSLVSYHLGRLRAAGLVSMRRSSADRRDAYYRVELTACGERLREVGAALHPGLGLVGAGSAHTGIAGVMSRRRWRVLFLCTGNSARSQMAEAFIEHLASGGVEAHSAGSHPKALHPNAVRVMAERGIDISGRRAKHLGEFARRRFDHVVSLCDRVREVCPEFPGDPETVHWSIADPSAAGATDDESYPAFERTATEIDWRVKFLLARIKNPAREKTR